jgi:hypothetical protein
MRRPVLSTFLIAGAIFGVIAGAHHHGSCPHHGHHGDRHRAFFDRVAEVCVDAARRHDAHPAPPPRGPRER